MPVTMAYDVGTSSLKAAVLRDDGEIIGSAHCSYSISQSYPGFVEQDPWEIWRAAGVAGKLALQEGGLPPYKVSAAIFVAPWKAVIPITTDGRVLRKALIWLDSRAVEQAERLSKALDVPMLTGQEYWPRLCWLKDIERDLWDRADKIVGMPTFLKWCATGQFVTDPSDDAFHYPEPPLSNRHEDLIAYSGMYKDLGKFPTARSVTSLIGSITPVAAKHLGLAQGTPVVNGFGDLPAVTLGTTGFAPGSYHIYLGTSSWLTVVHDNHHRSGAPAGFSIDSNVEGGVYPIQSCGLAFDWIVQQVYSSEIRSMGTRFPQYLDEELALLTAGSDNLLATHWLEGELPPLSKHAKALYVNLTTRHDRRHMVQAMMESICYSHRSSLETMERQSGIRVNEIPVVGGGALSTRWMQILADVTGTTIKVLKNPRSAGVLGAHYCALAAVSALETFPVPSPNFAPEDCYAPNLAAKSTYDQLYGVYRMLYPSLQNVYDQLNKIAIPEKVQQ